MIIATFLLSVLLKIQIIKCKWNTKKCVQCLLLFLVQIQSVSSQDGEWDTSLPRETEDTIIHGLIGSGEALLPNGIIMLINKIYGSSWALPTAESVRINFSMPWEWENTDGFLVNQIGHPYHGSMYFSAGRANGFGFYGSMFFSLLGSFTWESLCESNRASINDFIATVAGSLSTGEILYRLYVEACTAGVPPFLALFINPIAGFHSLVTGWKPPDGGRNLYQFQAYIGAGYAETNYSISTVKQDIFSFKGPIADIGIITAYGNPFDQDTQIPFRHFELNVSLGTNPGLYSDFRVLSDGYLFSFSPVYNGKDSMSTGLSLNLDFAAQGKFDIYASTINQSSNALNWTIKYEHLFSQYTALQIKSHTGFTFLGASKYYYPDTVEEEFNNHGFGFNTKNFFSLEHKKLGKLEFDILFYALWTYPGTTPFSQGTVFWVFSDFTYSHYVSNHISIGITGSFVREWGSFSEFPDTRKENRKIMLFAAWNL